jgi:hypothetical protein
MPPKRKSGYDGAMDGSERSKLSRADEDVSDIDEPDFEDASDPDDVYEGIEFINMHTCDLGIGQINFVPLPSSELLAHDD